MRRQLNSPPPLDVQDDDDDADCKTSSSRESDKTACVSFLTHTQSCLSAIIPSPCDPRDLSSRSVHFEPLDSAVHSPSLFSPSPVVDAVSLFSLSVSFTLHKSRCVASLHESKSLSSLRLFSSRVCSAAAAGMKAFVRQSFSLMHMHPLPQFTKRDAYKRPAVYSRPALSGSAFILHPHHHRRRHLCPQSSPSSYTRLGISSRSLSLSLSLVVSCDAAPPTVKRSDRSLENPPFALPSSPADSIFRLNRTRDA